jgi:uncharacterized SAM-binding protein YcdF (DUF218 family)
MARRQRLVAAIVAVLFLLLLAGPLLVIEDELYPADAIVVIGGDHKPERVAQAAALFEAGYAPVIVISAGTLVLEGEEWLPEAEVMRRQALALGLPAKALLLETASHTTHQNAIYTQAIAQEQGWHSILLVTSAYHSRRARRLFRVVYEPAVPISVQPADAGICALCWPLHPNQAAVVRYEYQNWFGIWLNILF